MVPTEEILPYDWRWARPLGHEEQHKESLQGQWKHPWNVHIPPTTFSHTATQAHLETGWLPRNSQGAGRDCVLQNCNPKACDVLWDLEMELPISFTTVCRGCRVQRRKWGLSALPPDRMKQKSCTHSSPDDHTGLLHHRQRQINW